MKMRLQITRCLAFTFSVIVLLAANATAQHMDIEIEVEGGMLATDPRIGEGEFGEAPNPANVADEPGLEVDDGIFQPNDDLSFNAVDVLGKNLWFWDGADPNNVAFTDSPHALTIEHPVTGNTTMIDSSIGGGAPGFLIGFADAEGGLHQDLEFVLDTNPPTSGVYLFGLEFTSSQYATSEPLYMVLGSGVDEVAIDAAVDFVAETFSIPEPNSALLAALSCMACLMLRRRKAA